MTQEKITGLLKKVIWLLNKINVVLFSLELIVIHEAKNCSGKILYKIQSGLLQVNHCICELLTHNAFDPEVATIIMCCS